MAKIKKVPKTDIPPGNKGCVTCRGTGWYNSQTYPPVKCKDCGGTGSVSTTYVRKK